MRHGLGLLLALGIALGVGAAASTASAQSPPDVRGVRPDVMLLVDTSGSMERLPTCACSTPGCQECVPNCGSVVSSQENRWAITVEALTGSWTDFSCNREPRTTPAYAGQYDYHYHIPHSRLPTTVPQNADGILDAYIDRVKFGLMTFDAVGTLLGGDPLVPETVYRAEPFWTQQATAPGMFSFGDPKQLTFPGCATTYMINNGSRGGAADVGGLVSVGNETSDYRAINQLIQQRLVATRPYGGTPIAGMLDDVKWYYANNLDVANTSGGDPYYSCRGRYVILITDGYPDSDFRDARYSCATSGFVCPYDRPEDIAGQMCAFSSSSGGCDGGVDGVFVIGFDIDDAAARARLNDIADRGGTGEAFFTSDRPSLLEALSTALDQVASSATSRTTPAFFTTDIDGVQGQIQVNSGFEIGSGSTPWTGVLERKRVLCNSSLVPEEQTLDDTENDRFERVLNARNISASPRKLYTVIPGTSRELNETILGEGDTIMPLGLGGSGGATRYALTPFAKSNAAVSKQMLSVNNDTRRGEVIDWVHGEASTVRATRRLGDIYHSSPVIVGPPSQDIADESYNLFRQQAAVVNRPVVVYVGTNDGILHCFLGTNYTKSDGTVLRAGEELWGFIPPILLPKIEAAMSGHQPMFDATVVVRDIFYKRLPGQTPAGGLYHTVLVSGLRGGGRAFVALDVTDPFNPKFLWQFADPDMGLTYGRPALGQVLVNAGGTLQERAIALLPGGLGEENIGGGGAVALPDGRFDRPLGCPANGVGRPPVNAGTTNARDHKRCWSTRGRELVWIDLLSGTSLSGLDSTVFNAPLTGTPAFYTGGTGTIATRAFVTDADGVIWRIDFSSTDSSQWSAAAFHDIFWDGTAYSGQPAYEPAVLTTDPAGRVVVLVGTGDIDQLDTNAVHRVASITEQLTFDASGTIVTGGIGGSLNWQLTFEAGEQMTGPLELFDGKVYFGSFKAHTDPSDSCAFGAGRLWGVDYLRGSSSTPPAPVAALDVGTGTLVTSTPPMDNAIISGVSVTQRPNCTTVIDETDPYIGTRGRITQVGGGGFELIAQVGGGGTHTGGSVIGTLTRSLPPPVAITRIRGLTGSVE